MFGCVSTGNPIIPVKPQNNFSGSLEVIIEDPGSAKYFLHADKVHELVFNSKVQSALKSGIQVNVSGEVRDNKIFVSEFKEITGSVAGGGNQTLGTQKIAFILLNFADNQVQSLSFEEAHSLMNTVNGFYEQVSYGQTNFDVDVYGYFTLQTSGAECNPMLWRNMVMQNTDILPQPYPEIVSDWSQYDRIVFAFPQTTCPWTGQGTLGQANVFTIQGPLSFSFAWLDGQEGWDVGTTSHELGHNFGVFHSADYECAGEALAGNCASIEYGDKFSIMGESFAVNEFNVIHRNEFGWVSQTQIAVVNPPVSATYFLGPLESSNPFLKGIKIPHRNQNGIIDFYYYLEYRQPIGFDSDLEPSEVNGVAIRIDEFEQGGGGGSDTQLLDVTPHESNVVSQEIDSSDVVLRAGEFFNDPQSNFSLTVLSASSEFAQVRVGNSFVCESAFEVNQSFQELSQLNAKAGVLDNGKFVVAWNGYHLGDNAQRLDVAARVFSDDSVPIGSEFVANSVFAGDQEFVDVASLSKGKFVLVWQSTPVGSIDSDIFVRVFNADYLPLGPEKRVNLLNAVGAQKLPRVVLLSNGNFVVVFEGQIANGDYGVSARVYDEFGNPLPDMTKEFVVANKVLRKAQKSFEVIALDEGDFAVTWVSEYSSSEKNVFVRVFDSSGNPASEEIKLNELPIRQDPEISSAALFGGGVAIVWTDSDSSSSGVFGKIVYPTGNTSVFAVNEVINGVQSKPFVSTLSDGTIVVVWQSDGIDSAGFGIAARVFGSEGVPLTEQFLVNSQNQMGDQKNAVVKGSLGSGFVIAFESIENGQSDVYARLYDLFGNPIGNDFLVNGSFVLGNQKPWL